MRKFPVLLVTATVMPVVSMGGLGFERPGIDDFIGGGFTRIMPSFSNDVSDLPIGYSSFSSFSSSPSSSSSSTPSSSADYFYSEKYGPFSESNPNDVTASFTYGLNSIDSQYVIERMRIFQGSTVVSATSKATFYYEKGTRKTVSFDVPIRNYLSTNGLTIKIEILNSSYSVLKAFATDFNLPSNSYIQPHVLKSGAYTSKSLGFYGDGETMQGVYETFDFTSIGDYLDVDYYYRLDVSNNKFSYPNSDLTLDYKSIYLSFNDSEYMFPSVTHDGYGDIKIPLTIQRVGNKINFKYKNSFYVHKRSLDISDTYKQGYVLTSDFYLPINGRKRFNGKNLYIEINEMGLDKISTKFSLRYDIDKSIVGLSTDGTHYVTGGNKR